MLRTSKQQELLKTRLVKDAERLRDEAKTLPPGHRRDSFLRKARQNEILANMTAWLSSPGLRPPT